MTLSLTDHQLDALIAAAKTEVVRDILASHADQLTLVSKAQAAGMLDVDAKTLDSLKIPRVVLVPKKKIAYRLVDIAEFISRNMEY